MIQSQKLINPDLIGATAIGLCFIHCAATPFLFIAKASTVTACADAPLWWQAVDYIFLVVAFAAIYHATKHSSKEWVKVALWVSWALLLLTILSESLELGWIPGAIVYLPALAIIGLHVYNYKYCKCAGEYCCINDRGN